jgi:hypothetical protein
MGISMKNYHSKAVFKTSTLLLFLMTSVLLGHRLQAQNPFPETPTIVSGMSEGTAQFVDFDQDGDLDLCTVGQISPSESVKIYPNVGGSYQTPITLAGLVENSSEWLDYDLDGDLDLLISGSVLFTTPTTILYRNDGGSTFTAVVTALPNLANGSLATGDFDNDGDADVFIAGYDATFQTSAQLFWNENGTFTASSNTFPILSNSFAIAGDTDNDGDLDLLFSGRDAGSNFQTFLFTNASGNFTQSPSVFAGVEFALGDFGDYDADGDLDLALSGRTSAGQAGMIYTNTGSNTFVQASSAIDSLTSGNCSWGDVDNDGDLDLLVSGENQDPNSVTSLYICDSGNWTFANSGTPFEDISYGSSIFGDYDGDGKLDVFVIGTDTNGNGNAKLYHNEVTTVSANANPQVPTGLTITSTVDSILQFTWTAPTDDNTPSLGLSYELIIGTSSGSFDIASPPSNPNNGYHKVASFGGIQGGSWQLKNPACGVTYFAKVQAVDGAYAGSTFSAEISKKYPLDTFVTESQPTLTAVDGGIADSVRWLDQSTGQLVPGATGASFTSTANGSFAAVLYRFGCVDTSSFHTVINAAAADLQPTVEAVLFPNPAGHQVTVRLQQGLAIRHLSVYDMQGRALALPSLNVRGNEATLQVDGLAPGIYLLKATTSGNRGIATATFVKE